MRRLPRSRALLDAGDAIAAAGAAEIPCWEIARGSEGTAPPAPLAETQADLVCVACFPWRLQGAWLAHPRHGAVNLHPSLLPAWRGPAPLFWQLRAGSPTGVTVHRVDGGLDTGPVVAQQAESLPDGARTAQIESRLAGLGARLLVSALRSGELAGAAQDESAATRQGWPAVSDRRIPRSWTARRAYNFVRGAERWGPFEVEAEAGVLTVRDALGHQPGEPGPRPREVSLRFAEGWLRLDPG